MAAILEDNLCPPAHLVIEYKEISPNLGSYIYIRTFDRNDIKFGRVLKNVMLYNISNVWTCSSYLHNTVFDDVISN